jgi:hypothetical protein
MLLFPHHPAARARMRVRREERKERRGLLWQKLETRVSV